MDQRRHDDSQGVQLERLRARLPQEPPAWTHRRLVAVPVIVAVNVVVYLTWQMARGNEELARFMIDNFWVSSAHLFGGTLVNQIPVEAGHYWTLLTSVFSHSDLWHILINMIVLWSFGSIMERLLGTARFAVFYVTSGVFASAAHCVVSAAIGLGSVPALGASGAVSAILLAYALTFPKHRILLFGVVPMPALVGALLFVGLDVWGLIAQGQGGGLPIGHGAHLGGALAGSVFWWFRMRGRLEPGGGPASGTIGLDPSQAREFDRLRRKLAAEGPEGLTEAERTFLRNLRERALDQAGRTRG